MLRYCDSFNLYATADIPSAWSAQSGSPTIAAGGPGGGNKLQISADSDYVEKTIDAQATWTVGARVKCDSLAAACPLVALLDGSTIQVWARAETDGSIKVYRGSGTGNLLGATTGVTVSAGVWIQNLELKATIHPSAGAVEVRVNGVSCLLLTGINTRASANSYADRVRLQGKSSGVGYAHLYVNDAAGSQNTGFLGNISVVYSLGTADGAVNDFTPSTGGSRYNMTNEVPPDGDATYVASATPGNRQLFTFAPFAALGGVLAVQPRVLARKDDGATHTLKLTARPASTNFDGAAQDVKSSYTYLTQVWEKDPQTTAGWTLTGLNNTQFGFKLES